MFLFSNSMNFKYRIGILLFQRFILHGFSREYIIVSPFLTAEEIKQVQLYARRKMLIEEVSPLCWKGKIASTMTIANRMEPNSFVYGCDSSFIRWFSTYNRSMRADPSKHSIRENLSTIGKGTSHWKRERCSGSFICKGSTWWGRDS